jgi:hypothetical protein
MPEVSQPKKAGLDLANLNASFKSQFSRNPWEDQKKKKQVTTRKSPILQQKKMHSTKRHLYVRRKVSLEQDPNASANLNQTEPSLNPTEFGRCEGSAW